MKKSLLILLFCSLFITVLPAKGKNNKKDLVKMEGLIQMYGNEPFSYPGIITSENKNYSLVSDNQKIFKKILNSSGNRVIVWGHYESPESDRSKLGFQKLKDGFFVVKKIKIL